MNGLTKAAQDVLAERAAQQAREGYDDEHDDSHPTGDLALAGASYALSDQPKFSGATVTQPPPYWPWSFADWKPKDRRRDLVRGAALLLAEIERLDRAAAVKVEPGPFGGTLESGPGYRAYSVPVGGGVVVDRHQVPCTAPTDGGGC